MASRRVLISLFSISKILIAASTVSKSSILTSAGKAGDFTMLVPSFAFLTTTLTSAGNNVDLTVVSNGNTLTSVAQTPNQQAVAAALQNATPTLDLPSVLLAINSLSLQEIGPAYDSMGGEQLSQFPTTEIAIAWRLDRAIQARIRGLSWREQGVSPFATGPASLPRTARDAALGMSQAQVAARPKEEPRRLGGWIDGYGLLGDMSGDSNASDLDYYDALLNSDVTEHSFSLGVRLLW